MCLAVKQVIYTNPPPAFGLKYLHTYTQNYTQVNAKVQWFESCDKSQDGLSD